MLRAERGYLHGRKFVAHTGHRPLKFLETQEFLTLRQVRWLEQIFAFDFNIVPIKGRSNQIVDDLSRRSSKTSGSHE